MFLKLALCKENQEQEVQEVQEVRNVQGAREILPSICSQERPASRLVTLLYESHRRQDF